MTRAFILFAPLTISFLAFVARETPAPSSSSLAGLRATIRCIRMARRWSRRF